ncbi:MAG TPA: hypothetical protein VFE13_06070 [Caulobacteraceae bacterium]|jgi:hypothetical protein|nr:hypothetical protein [Caulobacteraceae bacterium]
MADFEVYMDDDRYSVPSLYLISADCVADARVVAQRMLDASDHHLGVELRRDGLCVYALGTLAAPARSHDGAEGAACC